MADHDDPLASLVRPELRALAAYEVPRPPYIRAKLDANESPFSLPGDVAEALGIELSHVPLHRYPAADCARLRASLARRHDIPPETLVFGNGSDELIAMLLALFSAPRPGRERATTIYPGPTFSVYRLASLWAGVDPVEVPLGPEFTLDEAAFEREMIRVRPNLAFFARPNNPTGTLWPREAVIRTAEDHPDTIVVHDEAYADYGGDSLIDEVARLPNLVVMRTLSKIGMAALRVGYLHARPALIHELEKLRPPYNIGALNQCAAVWLLEHHDELLRERCLEIAAARDRMRAALAQMDGVHPFESRANLILLRIGDAPPAPGDRRATAVWQALAARGVLVRNLDSDGPLAGCLRVTIGTDEENGLFLETLAEVLR